MTKPYGQGDLSDKEYAALKESRQQERAVFSEADRLLRESRERIYQYQLEQALDRGPAPRTTDRWPSQEPFTSVVK